MSSGVGRRRARDGVAGTDQSGGIEEAWMLLSMGLIMLSMGCGAYRCFVVSKTSLLLEKKLKIRRGGQTQFAEVDERERPFGLKHI